MASTNFQRRFKDQISTVLRTGEFSTSSVESDVGSGVSKTRVEGKTAKKPKVVASSLLVLGPKVPAALSTQSFSTLPKLPSNSPTLPAIHEKSQKPGKTKGLGALAIRSNSVLSSSQVVNGHKSSMSYAEGVTKSVDFHPYTIEDYKELKRREPVRLGGLGPVMVGREEWLQAKNLRRRRLDYSQVISTKKKH